MASQGLSTRRRISLWFAAVVLAIGPWFLFYSEQATPERLLRPHIFVGWAVNIVTFAFVVWLLLSKRSRARNAPWLTVVSVFAAVSGIQCLFAQVYYGIGLIPGSFNQDLTKFDAAYFTVSAATTAGVTSIAAVSAAARIVVIIHMVSSLFIVLAALTIAFERLVFPIPRSRFGAREARTK